MDETTVANALASCEQELQAGRTPDLRALGFWRAVAAVKRHPELVDRYATRIAAIDRAAFRRRVRLAFPVALGVIVLDLGLFGGLLLLAIATVVDHPWREIVVLVAAGALDVTTHGLAHLAVRGEPGSDALAKTIAFLKAHGTVIDPTQSWNELLGHAMGTPIAAFQPGIE